MVGDNSPEFPKALLKTSFKNDFLLGMGFLSYYCYNLWNWRAYEHYKD